MSVRSFVGFVADFPTQHNGLDPPGKELADLIAHRLADAGFAVDGPGDREGWAWECYTKDDQLEIITIVGFVDDMELDPPRQWLITNYCELGFLRRLFGGKLLEEKRCRFLRRFCEAMHQFITCDDRFSGVVWYNKETFDRPGDQPGATP